MANQQTKNLIFKGFTWTIDNFSRLNAKKEYSETFEIEGQKWRILLFPKGNKGVKYLSIYLDVPDAPLLPPDWKRNALFKLVLINQHDSTKSKEKETQHEFKNGEDDWGFSEFMLLSEFEDSSRGFLVQDKCIIEAKIGIELVAFKGFWEMDKEIVPLLEEVSTKYPSLIECQMKRSRRYAECGFTTLGQVLHFLKTTKVKDMNKAACDHLKLLWEELSTFGFDLDWLKPHVQPFLAVDSMDIYVQKATRVKKLRSDIDALDVHVTDLRAKLSVAEIELKVAKQNLAEEGFGFEEIWDLEAVLGYGEL